MLHSRYPIFLLALMLIIKIFIFSLLKFFIIVFSILCFFKANISLFKGLLTIIFLLSIFNCFLYYFVILLLLFLIILLSFFVISLLFLTNFYLCAWYISSRLFWRYPFTISKYLIIKLDFSLILCTSNLIFIYSLFLILSLLLFLFNLFIFMFNSFISIAINFFPYI